MYDAYLKFGGNQNFYSLINEEALNIQGRPIPFNRRDQVSLGLKVNENNTYKIAIASVDGLFLNNNRPIYLEDRLLHIIHNLKQNPYTFNTEAGRFDNRFVLRYTNYLHENKDFEESLNAIQVAANKDEISIESDFENIKSVLIYDILGREIYQRNEINATSYLITDLNATHQTLVVKILLYNGLTVTKKILH